VPSREELEPIDLSDDEENKAVCYNTNEDNEIS
jgi:hypothetical protein